MDRENVIKELHDARRYLEGKEWSDRGASPHIDAINDALALLKEDFHNCKLECLLQKYDELKEKYDALLKEQEPVESYMDFDGHDVWRCGKCGATIFHIYHNASDEDAKNYAKFCRHCGQAVKWDV